MSEPNEPKCITVDDQAESMKAMAISAPATPEPYTCHGCGRVSQVKRTKPGQFLCNECLKTWEGGKFYPRSEPADPNKKILVLHITTSFGKRYTCRTVEALEIFIDNYKADKKFKRDEDVNIELGFGRVTQEAYDAILACKYFIKT